MQLLGEGGFLAALGEEAEARREELAWLAGEEARRAGESEALLRGEMAAAAGAAGAAGAGGASGESGAGGGIGVLAQKRLNREAQRAEAEGVYVMRDSKRPSAAPSLSMDFGHRH